MYAAKGIYYYVHTSRSFVRGRFTLKEDTKENTYIYKAICDLILEINQVATIWHFKKCQI